ncbi:hypothetical protein N7447_007855 [Penicillium robsamsonii]|uniref:uncharacterized protein n=1 Tax=Penicillium robsamsonii TaxID=1792511 RepID=UPI0025490603|nr:uncharacterized protein N7447_007855 [Penicillium robsamsonii]KAJ5817847.1 hypothetical protein N7447_007855 [Penicillium robsamsonii]
MFRPKIHPRTLAVMPQDRQWALLANDKREPQTSRSVSDFLNQRSETTKTIWIISSVPMEGLLEASDANALTGPEYVTALQPLLKSARSASRELKALSRQREILGEGLEEQVMVKRQRQGELDVEILERAYIDTIPPKVMLATAKLLKNKKFDPANIKPAQLVLKRLSGDGIAHLFGVETLLLSDTSNGNYSLPTTHYPQTDPDWAPSRWKCVLTDEAIRHLTAITTPSRSWRWNELEFRSDARPAKRFLYFRFIVTYIFCKNRGQVTFTDKVEAAHQFWPTPGPYLRKAMLRTLARNISGHQLPENMVEDQTFEDLEHVEGEAQFI